MVRSVPIRSIDRGAHHLYTILIIAIPTVLCWHNQQTLSSWRYYMVISVMRFLSGSVPYKYTKHCSNDGSGSFRKSTSMFLVLLIFDYCLFSHTLHIIGCFKSVRMAALATQNINSGVVKVKWLENPFKLSPFCVHSSHIWEQINEDALRISRIISRCWSRIHHTSIC